MNAKKAKIIRKAMSRAGVDFRHTIYKTMRRVHDNGRRISYYRLLDPRSGRGMYQALKREQVWQ